MTISRQPSPEFTKFFDLVKTVSLNRHALHTIDITQLTYKIVCIGLKKTPELLRKFQMDYCKCKLNALRLVQIDGKNIEYIEYILRHDIDILLISCKTYDGALKYYDECYELKSNKQLACKLIQ